MSANTKTKAAPKRKKEDATIGEYESFLATKKTRAQACGFDCGKLSRKGAEYQLFDWQKHVVKTALKAGRFALFEDCGLGKSGQQIIWADEIARHTGMPVLILCPLAVAAQTVAEGVKFGVKVTHIRETDEFGKNGIFITNYDRLDKFADLIPKLGGVVLDESSLLKSMEGKTRLMLTAAFAETTFKLCCTATPAPNDYAELGQHAEFLNVMKSTQMLATWFINETSETNKGWRLKRHARGDFWRWVGSWAACISMPSDIGFSDDGYKLPPLELHNHSIAVDEVTGAHDGELFRASSVSAATLQKEARFSIKERCEKAVEIAMSEPTPCIVWCELNDESEMLFAMLKEKCAEDVLCVEVKGGDTPVSKENKLNQFTSGEARDIVTKPEMGGFGLNWQHCRRQVFVGQSWSMERQYQAMRRSYRFGQTETVHVHFVTPSTLGDVRVRVREKFAAHEAMKIEMKAAASQLTSTADTSHEKENIPSLTGDRWTIYNGDCVAVARQYIKDESVGLSVFSPPFSDLFTYSARTEDMGNCAGMEDFMKHFKFQIAELFRVTMPGRECAVHCGDLLSTKWKSGEIQLQDFSGLISQAFREIGWLFHSRITIWKSPVTEMQRTKAHGLLYKTLKKDSSNNRVGMPDYLMVFRKPGINPVPIAHTESDFSLNDWQEIASPVWMTIEQGNVLNRKGSKEQGDERHICPLQLDVIERAIKLWSAPGDLVYSPFTGIGSEGYQAIKMQRRFVGSELKASYFKDAALWMKQAESERELFSLDGASSLVAQVADTKDEPAPALSLF
jgi:DNA modification methylase